jgi:hypothetical protein
MSNSLFDSLLWPLGRAFEALHPKKLLQFQKRLCFLAYEPL